MSVLEDEFVFVVDWCVVESITAIVHPHVYPVRGVGGNDTSISFHCHDVDVPVGFAEYTPCEPVGGIVTDPS